MTKYALLIYGGDGYPKLSEEEGKELYARREAFGAKHGERLTAGPELKDADTARSVGHRFGASGGVTCHQGRRGRDRQGRARVARRCHRGPVSHRLTSAADARKRERPPSASCAAYSTGRLD